MALKWLERSAGKLACSVLRGRSYGNIALLPDFINVGNDEHKAVWLAHVVKFELADDT